jgi:hypothetical protein
VSDGFLRRHVIIGATAMDAATIAGGATCSRLAWVSSSALCPVWQSRPHPPMPASMRS